VLDGPLLKYYKTSEQSSAGRNEPPTLVELKGCISVPGCDVVPVISETNSRPHAFQLTPASRKVFLICAPDAASRDAWIEAIRRSSTARFDPQRSLQPGEQEAPTDPEPEEVHNVAQDSEEDVTLGDFELLKVIGRGTYGKVMQVRRRQTKEIFAMKVLKKEAVFARNDPKDLQHTIAERNVLALLNCRTHPFILGLKYAFHTQTKLYYVMHFCTGGDLYYLLSRCKKFRESQARFYAGEVFLAIRHLHSLGIIYRDLKPENVLLDADGHVKLTDFGLSKESETADTFCGTPVYLAPEIWMRKMYGFEVDYWSLGCVLYEMVVGVPPFWGDTIKDVYKKVINTQPKFAGMSSECQHIIEGMLVREPSHRLGSKKLGEEVLQHPFFRPQNWDDLLAKAIKPPFKSKTASLEDTNNFHKAFTNQRVVDSISHGTYLNEAQQANFEGFTYNPSVSAASESMGRMRVDDQRNAETETR